MNRRGFSNCLIHIGIVGFPARKFGPKQFLEYTFSRGYAKKANDLLVARRQKHQSMHWRKASSDGLAALRTLLLNGGWDLYWKEQ
jgi:hypothetical protein